MEGPRREFRNRSIWNRLWRSAQFLRNNKFQRHVETVRWLLYGVGELARTPKHHMIRVFEIHNWGLIYSTDFMGNAKKVWAPLPASHVVTTTFQCSTSKYKVRVGSRSDNSRLEKVSYKSRMTELEVYALWQVSPQVCLCLVALSHQHNQDSDSHESCVRSLVPKKPQRYGSWTILRFVL